MLRTLTRQTLAVAVAVAVVVSFVGAPVAAAAALDAESDGDLDSLSDGSTASADGAATDSGDDSNTDDNQTDDNQTDDGTDTDDGSTDDDTSDEGNSSDDGSTGGDAASDDSTDDDTDDSSDDRSLGSDGDGSTDNDSDARRTERVADAANGTAEIVENTTEGLDDSTESPDDDGVVEAADGLLASVSEAALDLTSLDFDNPFAGGDGDATEQTYDGSARDHRDRPSSGDGTGFDGADGADEDGAATAAGTGDGDRPDPADPAGAGAAIGLGAVATAAALRGSPVVAGSKAATSDGLLSTLLEKVRPFVLPLRYSRYDDSDPLEHEARERVYEIVNETPGSYLSEVSKEADLPLSTTRHHIKVLEREDLVTGAKLHGKRRFYPAYAEGIELAAALNDDSTANIIDAIARIGAASVSDLADELGRDPSTISHHLQRLEEDGVITRERDGRAVVNKLSAEARTALEPEATPADEAGEVVAGGAD